MFVRAEGYGSPALQAGQSLADARLGGASAARTALLPKHSTGRPNLHDSLLTAEHVPMLCLKCLCHGSQLAKPCRTVLADTLLLLQEPRLLQDLGCPGLLSGETPTRSVLMLHHQYQQMQHLTTCLRTSTAVSILLQLCARRHKAAHGSAQTTSDCSPAEPCSMKVWRHDRISRWLLRYELHANISVLNTNIPLFSAAECRHDKWGKRLASMT